MPPSGLKKQIQLARGLAENGAILTMACGIPAIAVAIVILYFTTVYNRGGDDDDGMPWYYLIVIGAVGVCAVLVATRYVASGAAYGVLGLRDGACEMWQRRLDEYVLTGRCDYSDDEDEDNGNSNGNDIEKSPSSASTLPRPLLTPLAIVTGANSGVGYVTAETLLQCGHKVLMACRNAKAAEEAREEILKSCRERVWARYREAFQFDDSPLPDGDFGYGVAANANNTCAPTTATAGLLGAAGEVAASATTTKTAEAEAHAAIVKKAHWEGVKHRARALMAALPHNLTIVPLDVSDVRSIEEFAAAMIDEHRRGVAFAAAFTNGDNNGEEWVSAISAAEKTVTPSSSGAPSFDASVAFSPLWAKGGAKAKNEGAVEAPVAPLRCYHDGLRVLVNNAGCYNPTYGGLPPFVPTATADTPSATSATSASSEQQQQQQPAAGAVEGLLGVNYVGPTLLTHLLLKGLKGVGLDAACAPAATTARAVNSSGISSREPAADHGDEAPNKSGRALPLRVVSLGSVAHTWALNECAEDERTLESLRQRDGEKGNEEKGSAVASSSPSADAFLSARLLRVLDAVGAPHEATLANNATLRRYIKNTYGLSKLGAAAITRALVRVNNLSSSSSSTAALQQMPSGQMALPSKPKATCKEEEERNGLNITAFSLHPGAVRTAVFRSAPRAVQLVIETAGLLLFKTAEEGAALQLYLSLAVACGDSAVNATAADRLSRSVLRHDAAHRSAKGTSERTDESIFSSSIAPVNPWPLVNGCYYTDGGPADASSSSSAAVASAEALSDAAMLAMNRWAMQRLLPRRGGADV